MKLIWSFIMKLFDKIKNKFKRNTVISEAPLASVNHAINLKEKKLPKNYVEFIRNSRGKKKRAKIYRHILCKHHFGNFQPIRPINH